jgi:hypothetical protein
MASIPSEDKDESQCHWTLRPNFAPDAAHSHRVLCSSIFSSCRWLQGKGVSSCWGDLPSK